MNIFKSKEHLLSPDIKESCGSVGGVHLKMSKA